MFSNSGFKSSSFHSDFGSEFDNSNVASVLVNHQQFPKGDLLSSELTDLYCSSKSHESYSEFKKSMLILQKHTKAYMDSVDTTSYHAMASALTAVPEFLEIKALVCKGMSGRKVCDFYICHMTIKK